MGSDLCCGLALTACSLTLARKWKLIQHKLWNSGCSSPVPHSGTMTCYARSITCARPAYSQTRESMKPSRSCTSGDGTPAPGCSTCDTATLFTRIWPALSQHPIAGSRCALRVLDWYTYGPWPFGRHSTSVSQPHPSRAVDCKRNLNGPIRLDHHTAVEFRRGVAICRNTL